ncbi:MAG: hypothetical protein FWG36_06490 [Oscillospiraceae bacterium]|nr:hypothetical protein [Oscillospiraceae bacterium]
MNKQTWAITKLNIRNINMPYFVTGIVFVTMFMQQAVYAIIMAAGGSAAQLSPSAGIYLWLLVILAAIRIPLKNFRRITNLGGKRGGFFTGSIASLVVLSGLVSAANTVFHYAIDGLFINSGGLKGYEAFIQDPSLMDNNYIIVNLIELFGWTSRGIFFAFIQQFAFLILLSVAVYTLTAIQDKWYGWVTDAVIAAILGTFIPIAPLRAWLVWFLELITFNSNALIQIAACLVLSVGIYALNKPVFARKAI